MTYKILSVKNEEQIIIMNVEYTFDDLSKLVVDVPVFAPMSVDDISLTLANRGLSEEARIIATNRVLEILPLIPINTEIPIVTPPGDSGSAGTSGDAGGEGSGGDPVADTSGTGEEPGSSGSSGDGGTSEEPI